MCEHVESTTKPGKKRSIEKRHVGRPSKGSMQSLITSVRELVQCATPVSSKLQYVDEQLSPHLECPICLAVLSQPVELGCRNLVCADCCCKWMEVTGSTGCPICYHHELTEEEFSKPPTLVIEVLAAWNAVVDIN